LPSSCGEMPCRKVAGRVLIYVNGPLGQALGASAFLGQSQGFSPLLQGWADFSGDFPSLAHFLGHFLSFLQHLW
ncbi:hypothetical protein, partial [Akkermansia muciniphila]|uniref:hypothetical protein n=1 Tax=Akkermansia muciniphila TaxID=239935 RepID=UPI00210C9BE0